MEHGVNGILEACRTGHGKFCQVGPVGLCLPSPQPPPWGLTKIGFLQKYLCKGPADATNE